MIAGTAPVPDADADAMTTLRAAIYRLLLLALDKPSPERHEQLRGPAFRQALTVLCGQYDLPVPDDLVPEAFPDYESRYLATFEVGLPAAPVVLLASHHGRHEPAPKVVHEHILFYRHFDADPTAETGEAPDHLINELRFLVHLDELREGNPAAGEAIDRARADFLDRHPLRWVPVASDQAERHGVPEFYCVALLLLEAMLRDDRATLPQRSRREAAPSC